MTSSGTCVRGALASVLAAGPPLKLSVVVPVLNSGVQLRQCLLALSSSDYEHFDVLVVDDGSEEALEGVVRGHGFDYMRLAQPGGPAAARNAGAERATGEVLMFVDADCVVHPDAVRRVAQAFGDDPGVAGVIGTYDEAPADPGFVSQYKNLAHRYVHVSNAGVVPTFWAGCGAIRRDIFLKMGGFDAARYRRPAIEDIELGTWMTLRGHRILLDPRVQCKHLKRWTLSGLVRTDLFDRGVPWLDLMRRTRKDAATLNVSRGQRMSVVLAGMTLLAVAVGSVVLWSLAVAACLLVLVTCLNWGFYQYFARERGLWFALRVVPMHWLYFGYCGVAVLVDQWRRATGMGKPTAPGRSPEALDGARVASG